MTPPIPASIKEARVQGYVSIYEILPNETRLYGTESLFGDWNGEVLVLAQDFAPVRYVQERIAKGCEDPYSHNPKMQTNQRLIRSVAGIRRSPEAATCGILYGSALASLCKENESVRSTLTNQSKASHFGQDALRFTIANMPNLRVIMCLGTLASEMVAQEICGEIDWKTFRDTNRAAVGSQGRLVVFASHPMASVRREITQLRWCLVQNALGNTAA